MVRSITGGQQNDHMSATLSAMKLLVKYASDTNLLVPSDSDIDFTDKFNNVIQESYS